MAKLTYLAVIPSPIQNVTVTKVYVDGVFAIYQIKPEEGYVLHDKARDYTDVNPVTFEETHRLGYTEGMATHGPNYEFTPVEVIDEYGNKHTGYGSREFFAIPIGEDV